MSRSTINHAIKAIGYAPATAHGMRALLFTWRTDQGYDNSILYLQLAHVIRDETDQSVHAQPTLAATRRTSP